MRETRWFDHDGYPFQSHYMELPEGRLHYLDEGSGPPLVFVHGTPSWSYDFRKLIAPLREQYRCIALDHLGFGLSDRPADFDYRLASHSRNLECLLTTLGVERYALVVHDFGGPIALPLALDHPERLRALCVVNSWLWSMGLDPAFEKLRPLAGSALMRFLYLYASFSARVLVKSAWGTHAPLTRRGHRHFTGLFPNRTARLGTWAFARALVSEDAYLDALGARLPALADVPALVVWGLADGFVGAPHLARWKRELPRARFVELDGVGHFPEDEASELVLEALEPLLEATQG